MNAVCNGSYSKLIVNPNYWRKNNMSDTLLYCSKSPSRCLGNDLCEKGIISILNIYEKVMMGYYVINVMNPLDTNKQVKICVTSADLK